MVGRVAEDVGDEEGKNVPGWVAPISHLLQCGCARTEVGRQHVNERQKLGCAQGKAKADQGEEIDGGTEKGNEAGSEERRA